MYKPGIFINFSNILIMVGRSTMWTAYMYKRVHTKKIK